MSWHTKRNEVPAGGSFLPEDYLQRKSERRGLFISMFLFVVVAMGVVGAFFVTHRRWNDVKKEQERINAEYAAETIKIEQLKDLEKQKAEVFEKAEITTAIKEKVPRSILLAELINRMPEQLTLTDLDLKSKRMLVQPKVVSAGNRLAGPQNQAANRGQTPPAAAAPPPPKPMAPKFDFTIEFTGLASTDADIADYVTSLNQCPLLSKVDMISATEVTIEETTLRKFNLQATIRNTADARSITPLQIPRLAGKAMPGRSKEPSNPMDPTVPRDETTTTNAEPSAHKE